MHTLITCDLSATEHQLAASADDIPQHIFTITLGPKIFVHVLASLNRTTITFQGDAIVRSQRYDVSALHRRQALMLNSMSYM